MTSKRVIARSDLAQRIAQSANISNAKANQLLNTVFDVITDTLAEGGEVRLTGFGSFRVSERAERTGRNPRTGEPITVPAGRRVSFSPGTRLNEAIRGEQRRAA